GRASESVAFFFQAEDGIRAFHVTGVQTCALPISAPPRARADSPSGHLRSARSPGIPRPRLARRHPRPADYSTPKRSLIRDPKSQNRNQLFDVNGFRDVVGCPRIDAFLAIALHGLLCDGDDGES